MRSAREEMRLETVHGEHVAQHSLMQPILLALVKMRPLRRTET